MSVGQEPDSFAKCTVCGKEEEEAKMEFVKNEEGKRMELACSSCAPRFKGEESEQTYQQEQPEQVFDGFELEEEVSPCVCARFALCDGIRKGDAFDEFTQREVESSYFITDIRGKHYKIDFCPLCGGSLG